MTKPIRPLKQDVHAVVLVPSEIEWQALRQSYEDLRPGIALGREFLSRNFGRRRVVFVNTGEDSVEAAVSAQYAVDRWSPRVLASDSEHPAFTHVASRNGLRLTPIDNLGLAEAIAAIVGTRESSESAEGAAQSGYAAADEDLRTTADVTTTSEISTTEDVSTVEDVDTVEDVEQDENESLTGDSRGPGREPV
jgi:hypothetical protein